MPIRTPVCGTCGCELKASAEFCMTLHGNPFYNILWKCPRRRDQWDSHASYPEAEKALFRRARMFSVSELQERGIKV